MSGNDLFLWQTGTAMGLTGVVIVTLATDVLTTEQTVGISVMLLTAGIVTILAAMLFDLGVIGSNDAPEVPTDG